MKVCDVGGDNETSFCKIPIFLNPPQNESDDSDNDEKIYSRKR